MPGQRTVIFQRYPRPEKECQSFSLIYSNRSLDIICKDKDEAEVWFAGLKTLISRSNHRNWRTESRADGVSSATTSPRTYTRISSPLSSPFSCSESVQEGSDHLRFRSPYESPRNNGLDKSFSDVISVVPPNGPVPSDCVTGSVHSSSSGLSDNINGNTRDTTTNAFLVSSSSAATSSSQGSRHDDGDALGDVYIWGEGTGEGFLGGGREKGRSCSDNLTDSHASIPGVMNKKRNEEVKISSPSPHILDSLLPKAVESVVILDVQNISCAARHATLVTKQGEVYSWGEESGGRLGHGIESDVSQPKLIDFLANMNVELVACGKYHSCAVMLSGDLYTWGVGNFGLLGHGNEVSHYLPKRVEGSFTGMRVSSISCGPWHSALVTSSGQLFTFGVGTFGVLGHGDRKSVSIPREVESLKGLRTVRAACGVWHTAAVVEVMACNSSSSNISSGKIFTWGDGVKYRLGHGDQETKLVPTCVAHLVEPTFCQVACGENLTVALTTSGHVYTMGSSEFGQLGNPQANGKLPVRVEGKLLRNFVEEISSGAYHVAVLTSKTEVYTWGKGAYGQLGHGDMKERDSPTLVDALKGKQVRSIVCGANFTAAICIHKSVDQSVCSGCRMPFNFTRKRHNCYNCALVFCHSCSSKKSVKASMAPNPKKPYRVCDGCFTKLGKALETDSSYNSSLNMQASMIKGSSEMAEDDKLDNRSHVQISRLMSMDSFKPRDGRLKKSKKNEFSCSRVSPDPNEASNWGNLYISKSLNPGLLNKYMSVSVPVSRIASRASSPKSRRTNPPRSTTPTPIHGGFTSPMIAVDDTKNSNDNLSQEVVRLKAQVENLSRKAQLQEVELERASEQLKDAIAFAGEETAKCKAAKEVIKSLTTQLKDMAERLPAGAVRSNGRLPSLGSFSTNSASSDFSVAAIDQMSNMLDSNGAVANGPNSNGPLNHEVEYIEHDEPGVYLTLTSLPGGVRELRRVRFSRKRFTDNQAAQWWAANRQRVCERHNVRIATNRPAVGTGN